MPRKALPGGTLSTSVRLPRPLHEKLEAVAGDRGIGEEIRDRLERSFDPQPDPLTAELLEAAAKLQRAYGRSWHEDAFAFAVFKKLIDFRLNSAEPKGSPEYRPAEGSVFARMPGARTVDQVADALCIEMML